MLRFKTKAELFKQYGQNWRRRAFFNPDGLMDYLLGTPVEKSFYDTVVHGGAPIADSAWYAYKTMLTDCETRFDKHKERLLAEV